MSHYHSVVWIDHSEAHVMYINPDDVETSVVYPAQPHHHLHNKRGSIDAGHSPEDQHFYHAVVEALRDVHEVLVVGPSNAKLNLIKHIQKHDPLMLDKVVGIETVDHPSDAQLVAHARKYFDAKDRMLR